MSHTDNGTRRPGTGFISVDNLDQSAANCWRVRAQADLHQDVALHWNIVPWYLGPASTKPSAADLAAGAGALAELVDLLPQLQVVVLAGAYAQRGWDRHMAPAAGSGGGRDGRVGALQVVRVPHPSPLAMAQPGKRQQLQDGMAAARALLDAG